VDEVVMKMQEVSETQVQCTCGAAMSRRYGAPQVIDDSYGRDLVLHALNNPDGSSAPPVVSSRSEHRKLIERVNAREGCQLVL